MRSTGRPVTPLIGDAQPARRCSLAAATARRHTDPFKTAAVRGKLQVSESAATSATAARRVVSRRTGACQVGVYAVRIAWVRRPSCRGHMWGRTV